MMKVLTWALEEPFKKEEMVTHQVGLLQRLYPRYVLFSLTLRLWLILNRQISWRDT